MPGKIFAGLFLDLKGNLHFADKYSFSFATGFLKIKFIIHVKHYSKTHVTPFNARRI